MIQKQYSLKKNGWNEQRKKKKKKLLYILMSKYNVIGHENKNNIHVLVNVYDSISMLNAPPRGGELARVYVIKWACVLTLLHYLYNVLVRNLYQFFCSQS